MKILFFFFSNRHAEHYRVQILRSTVFFFRKKKKSMQSYAGSDEISNELLKMLTNMIFSHLITLFNACVKHEIHSVKYKKAKTIALRKSEKENYSKPDIYRSIALLNMIDKVLKVIMILRLSNLAERFMLLLSTQMKERKE